MAVCTCLGCASATSFPVQIVTPIESCNIPQCSSVSFYCIAHDEEIEWLNPNNTVINSKSSSRIQSEVVLHFSRPFKFCISYDYSNSSDRSDDNYRSSSIRFWEVYMQGEN